MSSRINFGGKLQFCLFLNILCIVTISSLLTIVIAYRYLSFLYLVYGKSMYMQKDFALAITFWQIMGLLAVIEVNLTPIFPTSCYTHVRDLIQSPEGNYNFKKSVFFIIDSNIVILGFIMQLLGSFQYLTN